MRARAVVLATLLFAGSAVCPAQLLRFRTRSQGRSGNISTRHRITVNSLITEPGTFEWEWYGSSFPETGAFAIPTVWKVTPGKPEGDGFWSHTELSASFDVVARQDTAVQASDHLTLAMTTALPSIGPLQLALAPSVTQLFRTDDGIRAGGLLLGKIENGRHSGGFSVSWNGATQPSPTNPAGIFDAGGGYGFRFARGLTAHSNLTWERATGFDALLNLSEGVEWQVKRTLSTDVTVQHLGFRTGQVDHQIIGGITWNMGRVRRVK